MHPPWQSWHSSRKGCATFACNAIPFKVSLGQRQRQPDHAKVRPHGGPDALHLELAHDVVLCS
jgi:hypothetical protein